MSLKIPVSITDHAQGNLDADLVIVEYGDYQCPYCGAAYPVLKKLLKKFSGEVKFVFRNFPLSEMHEYALPAAIAAEAAFLQDKFWEMHDAIYENQRKLDDQYLFKIAEKIGLDMEKFKSDIQKEELVNKIDADLQGGVISGVNGTPSFYVNGKKFNGAAEDLFELFTRSTGEI
ncbi:thioredoxin domain-containing protein [Sphingobacterium sp. 18053]|uniref:DsbA family protein n=1 Tax=Sphingobacterium sp. 18053 TaxID=2681401 RepID=UPI001359FBC3|nr:thioredoxin domain-containing protein [Sphingobacterium sp. 18053]